MLNIIIFCYLLLPILVLDSNQTNIFFISHFILSFFRFRLLNDYNTLNFFEEIKS